MGVTPSKNIERDREESTSSSRLIMEEKQRKDIAEGDVEPPQTDDSDAVGQVARRDFKDIDILSCQGALFKKRPGKYSIFNHLSRALLTYIDNQ